MRRRLVFLAEKALTFIGGVCSCNRHKDGVIKPDTNTERFKV